MGDGGLERFRGLLSPREREVLERTLFGSQPLRIAGKALSISYQRVQQLKLGVINKAREFAESGTISDNREKSGCKRRHLASSDEELMELARGYKNKTACMIGYFSLWRELTVRNLIERAFAGRGYTQRGTGYTGSGREELLRLAAAFSCRTECLGANAPLYKELKGRGLVSEAFGPQKKRAKKGKYVDTSREELLGIAAKFSARGECQRLDSALYLELSRRRLFDAAFGAPLKTRRKNAIERMGDDKLRALLDEVQKELERRGKGQGSGPGGAPSGTEPR